MKIDEVIKFLRECNRPIKIMEVCGSHTSVIVKSGVRQLLSPNIRLVSGPGCPVCVTPESHIDTLIAYSMKPNHTVLCFGDLFRVPGGNGSLSDAKASGGQVELIYSPLDSLIHARNHPETTYVVAAVGFETTAPVYAVLLDNIINERIKNIRLMTSVKTMPQIMDFVCESESIDGFICPGHVSLVTGLDPFTLLCEKHHKPFVIAGFEPEHILAAIYEISRQIEAGEPQAVNLYKGAVTGHPQAKAIELLDKYFTPSDTLWRGIGTIKNSGLSLRPEYEQFGVNIIETAQTSSECHCSDVMLGRISPEECPMFGSACTPDKPVGACMVSAEGSCGIAYEHN